MNLHITAFGFLFPFGMVLGLARNRWHVPVQILATALFVVGYFLAHAHAGRNYVSTTTASDIPRASLHYP